MTCPPCPPWNCKESEIAMVVNSHGYFWLGVPDISVLWTRANLWSCPLEPRPRIGRSLRRFQEKEGLSFSQRSPQKYQIILKPCRVSKSLVPQKEHPTCHGRGLGTENDASPWIKFGGTIFIASYCHILRQTSSNIIIIIIIMIISCYITIYNHLIKHHRADLKKH